ncbi:MAG TPA: pirin family protein [Xanthomonadales bacterium]|nr:pirin family protein [Xanthomonadales bacterium]
MITVRRAAERGPTKTDWLDSRHTFSFGGYRDDRWMGFGPLRVINEDRVSAGAGFPTHGHANMEIVTLVLDGALAHKDSLGTGSTIRPGDVQRMSAGSGILHSEFNASREQPVHFLQIWIEPSRRFGDPEYGQKNFPEDERRNRLRVVLSPDGADGSISIRQDARLYCGLFDRDAAAAVPIAAGRRAWVQVAKGRVDVAGTSLGPGDGAALTDVASVEVRASEPAEVLVFDLP